MNKKNLSESDICDKFVRPAMVVVRGKTARRDPATVLRADYALFFKANIPLAVVEVKKARLSLSAGIQQAIQYA